VWSRSHRGGAERCFLGRRKAGPPDDSRQIPCPQPNLHEARTAQPFPRSTEVFRVASWVPLIKRSSSAERMSDLTATARRACHAGTTSYPASVRLITMSKRLQVTLDESEMKEIRMIARRRGMTVAAWVRGALRAARAEETATDPQRKLDAIRVAVSHSFPTADIEEMLAEIAKGYSVRPA
jgi:hypothetical protein